MRTNIAPTQAEIMLDQVTSGNAQIRLLKSAMDGLSFSGVELSNKTQAKIQTFRDELQSRIDQLTLQREKVINLVDKIPDGTAKFVLQLRYGLLGNATKKTPWMDVPELINYEMSTAYKYHRKGIDYLNEHLEKGGENQC